jgi:hypothetical protein
MASYGCTVWLTVADLNVFSSLGSRLASGSVMPPPMGAR